MCTTNACFLEKALPEVVGWKVLERDGRGFLYSYIFPYKTNSSWMLGKKILANGLDMRGRRYEPEEGFHIFKHWVSALLYSISAGRRAEIHKVKGYNVKAQGRVSGGFLPIYIAQEAELVD